MVGRRPQAARPGQHDGDHGQRNQQLAQDGGVEAAAGHGLQRPGHVAQHFRQRGQQQRAAIARTLVQRADIILADEPIASLDPEASRKVMDILARINREDGTTVVVSLHQVDIALKCCPRTVALHRGKVVYDGASCCLTPRLLRELYGAEIEDILPLPAGAAEATALPIRVHPAYVERQHAPARLSEPVLQARVL